MNRRIPYFNIILAILAIATIVLSILIWNYQKKIDYNLNLTDFKKELTAIRELERDYLLFEAYRSYMNLKELYPNIWNNYPLGKQRFDKLNVLKGNYKVIIWGPDPKNNGLEKCIRKYKEYCPLNNEYDIWIENSNRADDFCLIVSRFRKEEEGNKALEYFKKQLNKGSSLVYDEPQINYRIGSTLKSHFCNKNAKI